MDNLAAAAAAPRPTTEDPRGTTVPPPGHPPGAAATPGFPAMAENLPMRDREGRICRAVAILPPAAAYKAAPLAPRKATVAVIPPPVSVLAQARSVAMTPDVALVSSLRVTPEARTALGLPGSRVAPRTRGVGASVPRELAAGRITSDCARSSIGSLATIA